MIRTINQLIERLEFAKGSVRLGKPDELVNRLTNGDIDGTDKSGGTRALLCVCGISEGS